MKFALAILALFGLVNAAPVFDKTSSLDALKTLEFSSKL